MLEVFGCLGVWRGGGGGVRLSECTAGGSREYCVKRKNSTEVGKGCGGEVKGSAAYEYVRTVEKFWSGGKRGVGGGDGTVLNSAKYVKLKMKAMWTVLVYFFLTRALNEGCVFAILTMAKERDAPRYVQQSH